MRTRATIGCALLLVAACSRARVEEGIFFPTWDAGGAVPDAIVAGTLVEERDCLRTIRPRLVD